MGHSRVVAMRVTPGDQTKVIMPPCSALELKNVAALHHTLSTRAVLECDLATTTFVLASLVPRAVPQAALAVVIANHQDVVSWFYLKARGTATLSVVGHLIEDRAPSAEAHAAAASLEVPPGYRRLRRADLEQQLSPGSPSSAVSEAATDERDGGSRMRVASDDEGAVEVLLPDGDEQSGYPSDAGSDDFVHYMMTRVGKKPPHAPLSQASVRSPRGRGAAGRGGVGKGKQRRGRGR